MKTDALHVSADLARRAHRHVIALGYRSADGGIAVTDVLCMNFPDLPQERLCELSQRLEQWSREYSSRSDSPTK